VHDLGRGSLQIGWISHAGCHDEIKGRAINGAGFCTGFFLAVFTSEQFCLELVSGHDLSIYAAVLIHGTPQL
jgi:hypothetical protein